MKKDKYLITESDAENNEEPTYTLKKDKNGNLLGFDKKPAWYEKVIYYVQSLHEKKIIVFETHCDTEEQCLDEESEELIDIYVNNKRDYKLIKAVSKIKVSKEMTLTKYWDKLDFLKDFVKNGYEFEEIGFIY